MPRPKPAPENATVKRAVSLPAKVSNSADKVSTPDAAGLEDFSSVVKTALVEYLNRHHPGLIEKVAEELRGKAVVYIDDFVGTNLKVGESTPGEAKKLAGAGWAGGDKAVALAAHIGKSPGEMAEDASARKRAQRGQKKSGRAKGTAKV